MTYADDFVRLTKPDGKTVNIMCKAIGLHWPPPMRIQYEGAAYVIVSFSQITDEERFRMTHVCRGAQYDRVEGEA